MKDDYIVTVVQYSQNRTGNSENCIFVTNESDIELNQDAAWFNSHVYQNIFDRPRSYDHSNKLLAIVRIEYGNKVIRRRYIFNRNYKGLTNNRIGLTSESARILFNDEPPSQHPVTVSAGNWVDTIMYYWDHPFHATRISFKIGFPALMISVISLILSLFLK